MNGKRPGGWVALSVRYFRDPKITRVSDAAELLYLRGLAYSGEHETDGNVQRSVLQLVKPRARSTVVHMAAELVASGLWVETDDGFAVPFDTWSRWQETAEQKRAARVRTAERQARFRERHGGSNTLRNAPSGAGAGAGAVRSTKSPVPRGPHGPEINHQFREGQEPDVIVDDDGRWFVTLPDDSPDGAA